MLTINNNKKFNFDGSILVSVCFLPMFSFYVNMLFLPLKFSLSENINVLNSFCILIETDVSSQIQYVTVNAMASLCRDPSR